MKKVNFWIYDRFNGKFLGQSYNNISESMPAFVYEIVNWFNNTDNSFPATNQEFWIERFREFKEYQKGNENFWEYILDRIGHGEGNMDWDFAKSLQLYDIIRFNFFQSENNTEKNIYEIFDDEDLVLILFKKEWKSPDMLQLDFQIVHYNDLDECHAVLSNSGLKK